MITHNLGYPRIGGNRELKKACESYWSEKTGAGELTRSGMEIRRINWQKQKDAGIDLIPSNDFSFYDHVLDMAVMLGAIPVRFKCLQNFLSKEPMEFYFALARGYQKEGFDITAMEMTKWFDTNYHYLVPEFYHNQKFMLYSEKAIDEFLEARSMNIVTKPVLTGPVSFLMLGKEKDPRNKNFDRLDLLPDLLPVYSELLSRLERAGAEWIQFDEPFLSTDLSPKALEYIRITYESISTEFPGLKILLATYFGSLEKNASAVLGLPVKAIHIDLVRAPEQLRTVLDEIHPSIFLSLGIVDGRNIWKNDMLNSLRLIRGVIEKIGEDRIMLAPSCSLLHAPVDLNTETDSISLSDEIKQWLAFSDQKLLELYNLKRLSGLHLNDISEDMDLYQNQVAVNSRRCSPLIRNNDVQERLKKTEEIEKTGKSVFHIRKAAQQKKLDLPLFPTTTIGSFPQTAEVRSWRMKLRKGEVSREEYENLNMSEIEKSIRWQEEVGLDVLVHGEFERNDMVEYFGEMLKGFAFTKNGWIQSYGSRCVKPPIIYGDVSRPEPMTIKWIRYAQSLTWKPVKGMLTGPVTMLQWSFVRDDQPLSETCFQIALALREEVLDLEKAGIAVIQIDEPALREGLPLRKDEWDSYLEWAVKAFRITYAGTKDETQIHTHMCYSEFNDIIRHIAKMDADVITIESSRSQMELLDAFADFSYPNDIGPGIYDIHSPRIPGTPEIMDLLKKALMVIPMEQLWINPDCGLKTRGWEETKAAIANMVAAARLLKHKNAVLIR
ncbi:MAG TPA: 5-methyltetrahydropteroyltriglutamate--homocysteine S-methyltransferase [Bacteroidales bacterium]|nr:5-methyltetrahydropteroyltriglutamate--homocysteine S-methyltransferase [Bacteroidales bacterium]